MEGGNNELRAPRFTYTRRNEISLTAWAGILLTVLTIMLTGFHNWSTEVVRRIERFEDQVAEHIKEVNRRLLKLEERRR